MEDCLVTKLKGVVNNDSLVKLGEMVFDLSANQVYAGVNVSVSAATVLYVSGTAQIWDGNNANRLDDGEKYTVSGNVYLSFRGGTDGGKITVSNKYNYNKLSFICPPQETFDSILVWYSGPFNVINLNEFFDQDVTKPVAGKSGITHFIATGTYSNKAIYGDLYDISASKDTFVQVNLMNTNIGGNISNIAGAALTNFNAWYNRSVFGDITSLGVCTSITVINALNTNITGSANSYAQAAVTAGRTSGSVEFHIGTNTHKRITFGSQYTGGYTITNL